VDWMISF